jgi:hypothetical protein
MVPSNELRIAATRQLAQRARQDRERRHKQGTAQPTHRELAQRARRVRERPVVKQRPTSMQAAQWTRRNQEYPGMHQLLRIARRWPLLQYTTTFSFRHQLGPCDIICGFCKAEHWIEERVQGSSKVTPSFSICCERGTIMMDEFDNPPQPLYSLLMELTPGTILPVGYIFANNEWLYNSVEIFEIIIMPSHSAPWASKGTCLFMVLREYTLFVFKVNFVIGSALFFLPLEKSQRFLRSISTIPILYIRHCSECLTIMIYSMWT